jgi:nitric oxide reductase large subunit
MTAMKRAGVLVAALIGMGGAIESGEHLYFQGAPAFISAANAVVGRPLTPVSVAGVARRSARR